MAERGYYSLLQFVPNPGRAEGANVGVVVICPASKSVAVRMAHNNDSPKRLFGPDEFDDGRLTLAKEALARRLESDLQVEPTLGVLQRLRALEGNSLALTEPRAIAVGHDISHVAEELLRELVLVQPLCD